MLELDSEQRLFHLSLQAMRLLVRALPAVALLLTGDGQADAAKDSRELQVAAAFELPQLPKVPGLPSLTGPSADWRQFDSFFTFVVKRFGDDVAGHPEYPLGD